MDEEAIRERVAECHGCGKRMLLARMFKFHKPRKEDMGQKFGSWSMKLLKEYRFEPPLCASCYLERVFEPCLISPVASSSPEPSAL